MKTSTIVIVGGVVVVGALVWRQQSAAAAAAASGAKGSGFGDLLKNGFNAFFAEQSPCAGLAPGAKLECERKNADAKSDSTKFGAGLDLALGIFDSLK